MGLRCLIGHDFGGIRTERDRRERGDEVIVTILEYRECARCGETRIVSENKEVRSAVATEQPTPAEREEEPAEPAAPAPDLDDVSAEEDDGVILADEADERQPGEWPEDETGEDDEGADDAPPWPEVDGADEGYAAEPSEGGDVEGVEFGSGLTPEAAAPEAGGGVSTDDGADVIEASGAPDHGGFRRARPGPTPTGRQRSEAAETEFFCPECEHTTPTESSSLRPGDICPNCRLGYLTEREP